MKEPKYTRVNARWAGFAVLKILKEQTDRDHPISNAQIVKQLAEWDRTGAMEPPGTVEKDHHRIDATDDTVKAILKDLQAFYGKDVICCKKQEMTDGRLYTYSYYYQAPITDSEVEMLINDVMFSRMRTTEQAKELAKKLKGLATPKGQKELNYLDQVPARQHTVNDEVEKNIVQIRKIIAKNKNSSTKEYRVSFTFCGYGEDKRQVTAGTYEDILPLRLCFANGNYYVIALMPEYRTPWHFRLDHIAELKETVVEKHRDADRDNLIQRMQHADISEYLSQHPYMFDERGREMPRTITLRIPRISYKPHAGLTFVHDVFGGSWSVAEEGADYIDIRVKAVPDGVRAFLQQYMDRGVRVMDPPEVKEKIEQELKDDVERYLFSLLDFPTKEEVKKYLEEKYGDRAIKIETGLKKDQLKFPRGDGAKFDCDLRQRGLSHFAYVKFFRDKHGIERALVAGKTNSNNADVRFELFPEKGQAKRYLHLMRGCEWAPEEIWVVRTVATDGKVSSKEAYEIEGDLVGRFHLFES